MGKSRKSIKKSINSLISNIEAHIRKIEEAKSSGINEHMIEDWEKEIINFKDRIAKEQRRLYKK